MIFQVPPVICGITEGRGRTEYSNYPLQIALIGLWYVLPTSNFFHHHHHFDHDHHFIIT